MRKSTRDLFIMGVALLINQCLFANSNNKSIPDPSELTTIVSPKNFTQSRDNKINGEVPPGKIGGVNEILLSQTVDGMHRYVSKVTREPGLRVYVHYHHFPVTTCIIQGQTTLYLEGHQPMVTKAGHCFTMPANTKGVNYNSGKEIAVYIDFMVLPEGVEKIVPLEKVPEKKIINGSSYSY